MSLKQHGYSILRPALAEMNLQALEKLVIKSVDFLDQTLAAFKVSFAAKLPSSYRVSAFDLVKHSEKESCYFQNKHDWQLWFPLFGSTRMDKGAMIVCESSHHHAWEDLTSPFIRRFTHRACDLKRGQGVLLNRNVVYKFAANESGQDHYSILIGYDDSLRESASGEG